MAPAELLSVLRSRDKVLHPSGGSAWKIECDSLDKPTVGFVAGVNKLLLGRNTRGTFRLVRSSDTGLGDHYLDPTGTGNRLENGRMAWPALLQEAFLADVGTRDNEAPLRIPPNLPEWAERPALRPARASTLEDLRLLRRQLGDPTIGPFARYAVAPIRSEHPPVCLGTGRDPATWQSWPWMQCGKPCRIAVRHRIGNLVRSEGRGTVYVVDSYQQVFRGWLSEHDVTVGGPKRGLRHVEPVRSHPALVDPVGRSGELAGERPEDDPVVFPSGGRAGLLAEASRMSGADIARRAGLYRQTVHKVLKGASPTENTFRRLVSAATEEGGDPVRCAAGSECRHAEDGLGAVLDRTRRRWCGPACKEVVRRRNRGIPSRRTAGIRPPSTRRPVRHRSDAHDIDPDTPALKALRSCPNCGRIFAGSAGMNGHCSGCGLDFEVAL